MGTIEVSTFIISLYLTTFQEFVSTYISSFDTLNLINQATQIIVIIKANVATIHIINFFILFNY